MKYTLVYVSFVSALLGPLSLAQGENALMIGDNSIVAMVNKPEGHLQLWKAGSVKPEWTLKIATQGGLQSSVAAMALRSDGKIVVVERHGAILIIGPDGKVSSEKTPAYEYIKLNVEAGAANWSEWDQQVETVSRTAAAFVSKDATQLNLVPNERPSVRRMSVDDIVSQPNSVFFLTNYFDFMFKDNNIVFWRKNDNSPIKTSGKWKVDVRHPTTLAVCKDWLMVGSEEGIINFVPETGDPTKAILRQVSKQDRDQRSILDAGCLGPNLAYTVSEDASRQILIWDLDTQAVVSSVSADKFGHPGIALAGVPAKSGTQFLSVGDIDIRLWSIQNKKLKLVSRYYPETREIMFTGAARSSGDFVVWDGETFWQIPSNGGPAVYFGGKKKVAQMKPCFSKPDDEDKCWSVKDPR
jgi:hypothetical protein